MSQQLANGWTSHVDAGSGNTYYSKGETTTWEMPAEAALTEAAPAAASEVSSAGLPSGWVSTLDAASGKVYYAHMSSGRTSWELPTEEEPPAAAEAAPPEPASSQPTPAAASTPAAAAAAAQPAAAGGSSASSSASAAAASKGAAAAPVKKEASAPKEKAVLVLGEADKNKWRGFLDYLRAEASVELQKKRAKFMGLRKFAEIAAKRKAEAAAKRKLEEEEDAESARKVALEASRPKRSILSLLELEVPKVEPKVYSEYAEANFNLNRKGLFKSLTTVDKVLGWKNEVISTALFKMPTKELDTLACQCHRNVLGFMGDRTSRKDEALHAEKLLRTAQTAPVELRDEVYAQIVKQLTGNPDPESVRLGWQLMGIACGSIGPSKDFQPYLEAFIASHIVGEGGAEGGLAGGGGGSSSSSSSSGSSSSSSSLTKSPAISQQASYALARLRRISAMPPRIEVPVLAEIEATRSCAPVLFRVYHLDGSYDTVPIASWTTNALVKQMVCEARGIFNGSAFGLFEFQPEGDERLLGNEERTVELVSYWQRLSEEERGKGEDAAAKKLKKKGINATHRAVFKVHMYFDPLPEDTAAQHEMFVQGCFDVVHRYPTGLDDSVALAGKQLQALCGDTPLEGLADRLRFFVPPKFLPGTPDDKDAKKAGERAALAERLSAAHRENAGRSAASAERAYLAHIREWQVYGCTFWHVEPQQNAELPPAVILGIHPKGVLIISPLTFEVLKSHTYSEIPQWGSSKAAFILYIGNLIKQTKLFFATPTDSQGDDMNAMIRSYVTAAVAKNEAEAAPGALAGGGGGK